MANNWAIVIGINQYEHLPPNKHLQFAVRDAEKVREFLCNHAGFPFENVLLCSDNSNPIGTIQIPTRPARTNLRRLLLEHIQQASEADNFWFFFAGHGISINGQDYLLPCDGYHNDSDSAISFHFVVDCLRKARPQNIVLILDMCREVGVAPNSSRGVGQETESLTRQQGITTIFSCNPGQSSYEISELRQGAFTYTLLKGLEQSTVLRQLETYICREVPSINRQYNKPTQDPLVVVEPGWKYDLPLLPERITETDVNNLINLALEKEVEAEYEIAKKLWWVVVQVPDRGTQNSRELLTTRARTAIARIDKKIRQAENPPLAPDKTNPPINLLLYLTTRHKGLWASAAILVVGLVGSVLPISCQIFGGRLFGNCSSPPPNSSNTAPLRANYFSRGEDILLERDAPQKCQVAAVIRAFEEKRAGVSAFANRNYYGTSEQPGAKEFFEEAVKLFEEGRGQDPDCPGGDPETLIYLNNLEALESGQPLTIAASVPSGSDELQDVAAADLRGVASAQKEFNLEGLDGRKMQVLIAKDDGDVAITKRVATHLAENNIPGDTQFQSENGRILGVIGHYTSDSTLAAGEIYEGAELSAIAPTSTAVRRDSTFNSSDPFSYSFNLTRWVFRTAPNDSIAAQNLVKRLPRRTASNDTQKAVVVYNSQSNYSKSISTEFKNALIEQDGEVSDSCDLSKDDCSTRVSIQLRQSEANVLMLAPKDADDLGKIVNIIESLDDSERSKIRVLGGDVMYGSKLLDLGRKAIGIEISVAWHRDLNFTDSTVSKSSWSVRDWGTRYIDWTAVSAYDATQALIQAFRDAESLTPQGIHNALASGSFQAQGGTGSVRFNSSHDRIVDDNDNRVFSVVVEVKERCKDSDPERVQFCLAE